MCCEIISRPDGHSQSSSQWQIYCAGVSPAIDGALDGLHNWVAWSLQIRWYHQQEYVGRESKEEWKTSNKYNVKPIFGSEVLNLISFRVIL